MSSNLSSSTGPDSTSSSLLGRVKAQDQKAWQKLVDLYAPLIYGQCRRSGLRPEDSRDVLQEVFSAVLKDIAGFRGTGRRGSFRSWLRTVTTHRISDFLRQQQGQPSAEGGTDAQWRLLQLPDSLDDSVFSDSRAEDLALERRAVELVRAEFEDSTWQAFWRVTFDAQPPYYVAEELGMTVDAVYKAKSRVLRRLRQEFRDLEDWG